MRVLFSVYNQDFDTDEVTLIAKKWVQTDWSFQQIEKHIAITNGFRSQVVIGDRLSFFDFFFFWDLSDDLLKKIDAIPVSADNQVALRTPRFFRVRQFYPGENWAPEYPADNSYYLYDVNRYECGANSYDALVYWAASHPLEMVFIGGLVYDTVKWAFSKIRNKICRKRVQNAMRPVKINTRKVYRNFSKTTKIDVADCQIIKLDPIQSGLIHIQIRTAADEKYNLKCYKNGSIESLKILNSTSTTTV